MAGLVAAEGAVLVTLDVLDTDEALEMLARRLGQDRVVAEPEAAAQIIQGGARLPWPCPSRSPARPARAQAPAGRTGHRTARRPRPPGRARSRQRGHRRARRAVLVLRSAQPGRRADVPPARPASGSGHPAARGGQPGRDAKVLRLRKTTPADSGGGSTTTSDPSSTTQTTRGATMGRRLSSAALTIRSHRTWWRLDPNVSKRPEAQVSGLFLYSSRQRLRIFPRATALLNVM